MADNESRRIVDEAPSTGGHAPSPGQHAADLREPRPHPRPLWNPAEATREMGIELARRVRRELGRPIGRRDFLAHSGLTAYWLEKHFDGVWTELRQAAGLERHPRQPVPRSDDELLADFHAAAARLGRVPSFKDLPRLTGHSGSTYVKHWGTKRVLVERYREWLEQHHPDSPLLPAAREAESLATLKARRSRLLTASKMVSGLRRAGSAAFGPAAGPGADDMFAGRFPPAGGAPECGEPIDFRGMRHAPVNEQGVVLLFGMVAQDLGFLIERVRSGFPDCEAKRAVDAAGTGWRHMRIEFEFKSRNFREHGHDPAACDLIVCWTHDWPDCPLEVLELATLALARS